MASTKATETDLFVDATGLKKIGTVGGTGERLSAGTRRSVSPSRILTKPNEPRLASLTVKEIGLGSASSLEQVLLLPPCAAWPMGRIWLLTGPPGVGKSTIVSKVILRLKSSGVIVGGCSTLERRSKGTRVGFDVVNLTDDITGELASIFASLGPKVGRYRVNLEDLARVGAAGLAKAAAFSELIVIDEVGPMELVSPEFRRGIRACIDSRKPILAVVHERLEDDLLSELRESSEETLSVTLENRETLADGLAASLLEAVGGPKTS